VSPILIDIIIIAVLVLTCIMGFKRGLMLSIVNAGSSVISFILSLILYPLVSKILKLTPLFDSVKNTVAQSIEKIAMNISGALTPAKVVDAISMPGIMKDNLLAQITEPGKTEALDSLKNSLSGAIAGFILDIIAIVVLFIIVKIIIMLLKNVIKAIASIPVIKQVDKIGGLAFGLLEGFMLLTVAAALLAFFTSKAEPGSLVQAIDKSLLGSYFYNNNLILNIISGKAISIPGLN